jgi:hypothetical protein
MVHLGTLQRNGLTRGREKNLFLTQVSLFEFMPCIDGNYLIQILLFK